MSPRDSAREASEVAAALDVTALHVEAMRAHLRARFLWEIVARLVTGNERRTAHELAAQHEDCAQLALLRAAFDAPAEAGSGVQS
jgi:hypothetical protein